VAEEPAAAEASESFATAAGRHADHRRRRLTAAAGAEEQEAAESQATTGAETFRRQPRKAKFADDDTDRCLGG
jgi:hypothetical protein